MTNVTKFFEGFPQLQLYAGLQDKLYFDEKEINYDHYYPSINTSGSDLAEIELDRKLSKEFLENLKSNRMLGLKITWNYDKEFKNWAKFSNEDTTKEFVR